MEEKNFYIYKHTNLINNKIYIGQTCQKPENRWGIEGKNYINNSEFYNDIKKYGWNNFSHEILYSNLSLKEADQIEIDLIKKYDSTNKDKGYNRDKGGHNSLHSEATKRKMRINQLGEKNSFFKHKHTEETKKLISEALKGENHPRRRKVKCIETGTVFNTLSEASEWCCGHTNMRGKISEVCNNKRKHAGRHPKTNISLSWEYV